MLLYLCVCVCVRVCSSATDGACLPTRSPRHGASGGSDPEWAFAGTDVICLVGGFPRKKGMERKDLIAKNTTIFSAQGRALQKVGKPDAKVLVVANPANTNANILMRHAPKIPRANFTAMTRLDHNRARAMLAAKAGGASGAVGAVKNMIIWGNHSATQVPDATHAIVGGVPARQAVEGGDGAWLDGEFTKGVQQRGAAVIAARGASSAMSAANGAADHMRDWLGSYGGSVAAGAGYASLARD